MIHVTLSCSALGLEHRWSKAKPQVCSRKSKSWDHLGFREVTLEMEMCGGWFLGEFWRSKGVHMDRKGII